MPPSGFDPANHPHRRLNPLTGEWVVVSPHRTKRPWQGQTESPPPEVRPPYDPACYLCPGNERASGARNPAYPSTYVFDNDFMGVLPDTPEGEINVDGLLVAQSSRGVTRVLCFSPRHDLTLARMSTGEIEAVVAAWVEQTDTLGQRPEIVWVQLFENRGAMMGASNPHPHGQIWATAQLPNEPAKELAAQERHAAERGGCLLCDYLAIECANGERVVCENAHWVALVPFWAVWPFETMVLPRRHLGALPQTTAEERTALADLLRRLNIRYDNLFTTPFPTSMGWHQQPTDGHPYPAWHLHAHFYPPLLRSATVRKFMVGFEMFGTPIRDITPEQAAERLRTLSEVHYLAPEP